MADERDPLNAFDRWLWSLDDAALAALDVRALALRAAEAGIALPQLTFLTVIPTDEVAIDVLRRLAAAPLTDRRQVVREADGMLVRTLTVTVGSRLSIHLRRHAGATFYRGDYGLFCSVVLHRLTAAAAERRTLLTGRERHRAQPIRESIVMRLAE